MEDVDVAREVIIARELRDESMRIIGVERLFGGPSRSGAQQRRLPCVRFPSSFPHPQWLAKVLRFGPLAD